MSSGHDKTVVLTPNSQSGGRQRLRVEYTAPDGRICAKFFEDRFVIGRDAGCQVQLLDDGISRKHLEVVPQGLGWCVRDLGSSNGTFLNGSRIREAPLSSSARIEFFSGGPTVRITPESGQSNIGAGPAPSARADSRGVPPVPDKTHSGSRRPVPSQDRREAPSAMPSQTVAHTSAHRRHFLLGMSTMAALVVPAIGYILLRRDDLEATKEIAKQIFYQTKALELQLSMLRSELAKQPDKPVPVAVREADDRLRSMQDRYVRLVEEKKLIGGHRGKDDLLIFRMARIFGEYDLDIPDDFLAEVKRYIHRWQSSNRLADSIERISAGNYAALVANEMREHGLPPQFIYLAVQESNFRHDAIGPMTRFGIAKGIWQFIPQTATNYGLRVGPKKDQRVYDPLDDRFDVNKATRAAADYLRFIYTTEAQASGLLVMSAYNWGEDNIVRVLNRFPDSPAQRNFWRLLETQAIPDETYGYVLSILSAAVIGEDPKHFGFDFENPLTGLSEA